MLFISYNVCGACRSSEQKGQTVHTPKADTIPSEAVAARQHYRGLMNNKDLSLKVRINNVIKTARMSITCIILRKSYTTCIYYKICLNMSLSTAVEQAVACAPCHTAGPGSIPGPDKFPG